MRTTAVQMRRWLLTSLYFIISWKDIKVQCASRGKMVPVMRRKGALITDKRWSELNSLPLAIHSGPSVSFLRITARWACDKLKNRRKEAWYFSIRQFRLFLKVSKLCCYKNIFLVVGNNPPNLLKVSAGQELAEFCLPRLEVLKNCV